MVKRKTPSNQQIKADGNGKDERPQTMERIHTYNISGLVNISEKTKNQPHEYQFI